MSGWGASCSPGQLIEAHSTSLFSKALQQHITAKCILGLHNPYPAKGKGDRSWLQESSSISVIKRIHHCPQIIAESRKAVKALGRWRNKCQRSYCKPRQGLEPSTLSDEDCSCYFWLFKLSRHIVLICFSQQSPECLFLAPFYRGEKLRFQMANKYCVNMRWPKR